MTTCAKKERVKMTKFEKSSSRYYLLFKVGFYLLPIAVLLFWLNFNVEGNILTHLGFWSRYEQYIHRDSISFITKLLAFAVSLIPCVIVMYGLKQLITVFHNYSYGDVFTLQNSKCYQKMGYAIFAWVIGGFIYEALISLVLSFGNPAGQRFIASSLSGIDMVSLIVGGVIMLISRVMQQAQIIADENRSTI